MGNKFNKNKIIHIKPSNINQTNEFNNLLNIIDKYDISSNKIKWYPDDDLYNKYNSYEKECLQINNYKNDIIKLKENKKRLEELINNNNNNIYNNKYDEIINLNNKTDLINCESEIIILESIINKFNNFRSSIIDSWINYYNFIKNLILDNDLYFVNINNLITSQNLYVYLLSQIRLLYNVKDDEENKIMNNIKKLNNVIDLKYIINKINNDNSKYVKRCNQLDLLTGEDKYKMFLNNKHDIITYNDKY